MDSVTAMHSPLLHRCKLLILICAAICPYSSELCKVSRVHGAACEEYCLSCLVDRLFKVWRNLQTAWCQHPRTHFCLALPCSSGTSRYPAWKLLVCSVDTVTV
jgi:hypothetical protein